MTTSQLMKPLVKALRDVQYISPVLDSPRHSDLAPRLNEYANAVANKVKDLECQEQMVRDETGWKNLVQTIKNAIYALNEYDNRTELLDWYTRLCFPTPQDFINFVLADAGSSSVTAYVHMKDTERLAESERIYRQVQTVLHHFDPSYTLPPPPALPTIEDKHATKLLLVRLKDLKECVPHVPHPEDLSAANTAFVHIRVFREAVADDVGKKKLQKQFNEHSGSFLDQVQVLKNNLYALASLQRRVQLVEMYLRLCLPKPDEFVQKVLAGHEGPTRDDSIKPWHQMLETEQVPWTKAICAIIDRAQHRHHQPTPLSDAHHPHSPHARPPSSASRSAPVPQLSHMDHSSRELQRFLYADTPLFVACQALFDACTGAGMSREAQRQWYRQAQAATRGILPPALGEQLVKVVEETTSLIQLEPAPDKVIKALKDCLVDLRKTMDRHASSSHGRETSELHSLGSSFPSSHPFHRLSHRQRVIYGRTFSSSVY